MLNPSILLAAIETPDIDLLRQGQKGSNPQIFGTDITVVLAVALGLAAILFFWVFFIRPKPTHARGSLVVSRTDKKDKEGGASKSSRRRRRRGDHPDAWSRNPTLSETGGLPPPRQEDSQAPPAQK
jgi:hypothetical protein